MAFERAHAAVRQTIPHGPLFHFNDASLALVSFFWSVDYSVFRVATATPNALTQRIETNECTTESNAFADDEGEKKCTKSLVKCKMDGAERCMGEKALAVATGKMNERTSEQKTHQIVLQHYEMNCFCGQARITNDFVHIWMRLGRERAQRPRPQQRAKIRVDERESEQL